MYACVCVCVCKHTQLLSTLCDPWTVAHQAPLSMEFSRQEYWNGLPFPSSINTSGTIQLHYFLEQLFHLSESEVAQSCLTLCDPIDGSLRSSSVHGIFQARVLEWVAIAFSGMATNFGKNSMSRSIAIKNTQTLLLSSPSLRMYLIERKVPEIFLEV